MTQLIAQQVSDALAYARGLQAINDQMPDEPMWGEGVRLVMPEVIPLRTDYAGDREPVAWLVLNDFDGYDLTTSNPNENDNKENK